MTTSINNAILSGSRGRGKAQPLTSKIFSEKGYIKMGDIKIGDNIYGEDGKLHKVLGIFPQGNKKVYEITFTDGSKTRCSDEHLWTVQDNYDMKWKTITVNQMLSGPLSRKSSNQNTFEARYKIPLTKPLIFDRKETFISPYLMGCLIGDGCFSKHNKYKDELISLDLYTHKSWEKFIPDIYLYNDIESRLDLLRGLLDTNGTITPDNIISYTTTSEILAEHLVFLVQSLGGTTETHCSKK